MFQDRRAGDTVSNNPYRSFREFESRLQQRQPEHFKFPEDLDPLGEVSKERTRVLTYSTKDVIDPRISVPAQHSLVRLSKNPATTADAVGMVEEVKAGRLAGIYCANWQKAAQRALRFGKSWWTVIPPGEDAALLLDPDDLIGGAPMILFHRELDPDCGLMKGETKCASAPARLDIALPKSWATYRLQRSGRLLCDLKTTTTEFEMFGRRGATTNNVVPTCKIVSREPSCGVPHDVLIGVRTRRLTKPGRELNQVEFEAPSTGVEPKVCFFQNVSPAEGLDLFKGQATRWAKRIRALAQPDTSVCDIAVGPTSYNTGLDILRALEAVLFCLNFKPVKEVHIFGHMYEEGIIGHNGDFTGLYRADPVFLKHEARSEGVNRNRGGRVVSNVDPVSLADDVIFVLHGCNTAAGDSNIARALFEFLVSFLPDPRVYGHHVSVCAGQEGFWREYSRRSPTGKLLLRAIPFYQGNGGFCRKAAQ
jgi:hypothetical protein